VLLDSLSGIIADVFRGLRGEGAADPIGLQGGWDEDEALNIEERQGVRSMAEQRRWVQS